MQENREVIAEFEVIGEPASKANQRKLVKINGKPRFIKSAKALAYVDTFKWQCPRLGKDMALGDVSVEIHIYYASRRPDLDESVILDCMEGYIYKNDRQVKEKHIYHHLDKFNSRALIRVEAM
jgi:Holliday junction resolvase RusA-like endonuclease